MNTDSGHIYPNLKELFKQEENQGIKVNPKHLIPFVIGDRMEIRVASFEIIEIKPHPENILILRSMERGNF